MNHSSRQLFEFIKNKINLYDLRERESLAFIIMNHLFAIDRKDVLADKEIDDCNKEKLEQILARVNQAEPIQYILETAHFYGRDFYVKPGVLIPRPETEELVHLIIAENKTSDYLKIVDIGSGSGCIGVTLAAELPTAEICSLDISPTAIEVTKINAKKHEVFIDVQNYDIVSRSDFPSIIDVIVSNPPYVTQLDKERMNKNVLAYEPHLALFAPENDPLFFYRKIALFGKSNLKSGGKIYLEINQFFGSEIKAILEDSDYSQVRIVSDIHGNDRIATGHWAI